MNIISLGKREDLSGCNAYLILGTMNQNEDLNTIIDPGTDLFILQEIERISTGFGRIAVEQIILTHGSLGHMGAALSIKNHYKARVFAYSDGPAVDELLHDGQFIKAGDGTLEVLHTPGHSSDSICLYAPSEKILFSGDMQLRIRGAGDEHPTEYIDSLLKIACRDVQRIYSGHDIPLLGGCNELILQSLRNANNRAKSATLFRNKRP
jgi:glyoxylase-like metal-dependent hydrolase (beta-lactamase superfamily II)